MYLNLGFLLLSDSIACLFNRHICDFQISKTQNFCILNIVCLISSGFRVNFLMCELSCSSCALCSCTCVFYKCTEPTRGHMHKRYVSANTQELGQDTSITIFYILHLPSCLPTAVSICLSATPAEKQWRRPQIRVPSLSHNSSSSSQEVS